MHYIDKAANEFKQGKCPYFGPSSQVCSMRLFGFWNSFCKLKMNPLIKNHWNTPLCSFCNKEEETPLHIFSECTYVIYIWQQLATFFENNVILPGLTIRTALLGLWSDNANHDEPIINHFLTFKLSVYNSREKHRLNIMDLLIDIKEIKKAEYCLSSNSGKKERYIKINGA